MFGSSIHVAPKVTQKFREKTHITRVVIHEVDGNDDNVLSDEQVESKEYEFEIEVYLPPTEDWYNFNTKALVVERSHSMRQMFLGDTEQGIFIRAGTILPLMQLNEPIKNRKSLSIN